MIINMKYRIVRLQYLTSGMFQRMKVVTINASDNMKNYNWKNKKINEKCPMKLRHELSWQYQNFLPTDRTICHTGSPVVADGETGQPKMPTCEHIDKELEH